MKKTPTHSKILSLGSAFPKKILTNAELEKIVDTSDAWIRERSGIQERHILGADETNSGIATEAAKKALKKANLKPDDINMILFCTNTPDRLLPACGAIMQGKLGVKNAPAFDIMAACAGWVVGISIADQYIKTGMYKTILVVGAEAISRFINWQDRGTCVLFGDGAAAALVVPADKPETSCILSTHMHTDSAHWNALEIPAGGSEIPITPQVLEQKMQLVQMRGSEIFKFAIRYITDCSIEACEANNITINDIDWFIPHQANIRIIEGVAKKLNLPMEKVILNVHKYGNTSAATIPSALDEAVDLGKIKHGDLVLMSTFGGGLTYASALIRW